MVLTRRARLLLGAVCAGVLAFVYVPLIVVLINSFNSSKVFSWPPRGYTTEWWSKAIHNEGVRAALVTSVKIAFVAMLLALVLGSMIAFAVGRYSWFGSSTVSLLVVLPIALPGIVTGVALNTTFTSWLGMSLGMLTVIIAHTTFCIVIVFNNVVARLRRTGTNLQEASADLGAPPWLTFRRVTWPVIRSSVVAGALLAFALSFDEIVVTTFTSGPGIQTLPQWIFVNLARPNQAPIVNAVAAALLVVFLLPVYLAQRMSDGTSAGRI